MATPTPVPQPGFLLPPSLKWERIPPGQRELTPETLTCLYTLNCEPQDAQGLHKDLGEEGGQR